MTDQITVPRETWDAMREAVERLQKRLVTKCQEQLVTFSFVDVDILNAAAEVLTAANAVSAEPQAKGEAIPHSGADENPPVFGRRWKIAADGFGLQRDDLNGRYVDIDDALSVLHAAHPQATEPAWRPIETAPKDTQILVAAEFYGDGDWRIKSGYLDDSGWHIWGASWTPTHWQPLPAAPEAKQ